MGARPAAGGGRFVDVAPERLERWLDNFANRHGPYTVVGCVVTAADGARAELAVPPGAPPVDGLDDLLRVAVAPRRLGLLLARRGAVAVGVADGTDLIASKVDTRYVQGRTAAGGWSQQRFARRRVNQARAATADATDIAARVLVPAAATLQAVVTGGDRGAVDGVLAASVLEPLRPLRADRFLDVGEPRLAVLTAAVAQARAVRIHLTDP